jgi:hypothetical protein
VGGTCGSESGAFHAAYTPMVSATRTASSRELHYGSPPFWPVLHPGIVRRGWRSQGQSVVGAAQIAQDVDYLPVLRERSTRRVPGVPRGAAGLRHRGVGLVAVRFRLPSASLRAMRMRLTVLPERRQWRSRASGCTSDRSLWQRPRRLRPYGTPANVDGWGAASTRDRYWSRRAGDPGRPK